MEGEKYKLFTPLVTLQKEMLNVLNKKFRMITESHPFVSFGKQVEFNNSEEGKMEVWSSNIIS